MTTIAYDDRLLDRVAHDLRACFRAGKTLPDWLQEDLETEVSDVPESIAENLDLLRLQAERGDQMVVDLVAFVRAGQKPALAEPVQCDDLFRQACKKVVPVEYDVQICCECEQMDANRDAIGQVLEIVLGNAVKHHDSGSGKIRLRSGRRGNCFFVFVDDDGPGIPPDMRERVFEPLTTLQPRDVCEGSGLGLAIANQLVSGMGGEITATDRPEGRGTRISIKLPD